MKVSLNLVLLVCTVVTAESDERIIGGSQAIPRQFPYQISIQRGIDRMHFCGGSLISPNTVLTAAHCIFGWKASELLIVAGTVSITHGGFTRLVETIHVHEDYDPEETRNDIALLKLLTSYRLGWDINTIGLRQIPPVVGEVLLLTGWGYTNYTENVEPYGIAPNNLQWIQLESFDSANCSKDLNYTITPSQVCTIAKAGYGSCKGDSGGPLVDSNGTQIGIVSLGLPCALGYPDVYTSVHYYIKWIQRYL